MSHAYRKVTGQMIREWWHSRINSSDGYEYILHLLPRLTDLHFIQVHAELGLVTELVANLSSVLAMWEQFSEGLEPYLPDVGDKPSECLRDCVTAVIKGQEVLHYQKDSGPVLSALVKHRERVIRQHCTLPESQMEMFLVTRTRGDSTYNDEDVIPAECFGEGDATEHAIQQMRAAEQDDHFDDPSIDEHDVGYRLRCVTSFVSGYAHLLAAAPQLTTSLAYNSAESGFIIQQASQLLSSIETPWFAREPRPPRRPDVPLLARTFSRQVSPIRALAISGDGSLLVSGGEGGLAEVWNARTGRSISVLQGNGGAVTLISITPDGTKAVLGEGDDSHAMSWSLWDLENGICLRRCGDRNLTITDLAMSVDGRIVVTAAESLLGVWDAVRGNLIRTIGERSGVNGNPLAITPDAKIVAATSGDDVVLWDLTQGTMLRVLVGHTHFVKRLAFSANGRILVSVSHDDQLFMWDVASGKCLRILSIPGDGLTPGMSIDGPQGVDHLCLSYDGRVAVTGSSFSRLIRIWDLTNGTVLRTLKDDLSEPSAIVLAGNCRRLATAQRFNLRTWDILAGKNAKELQHFRHPVTCIESSVNGRTVVALGESSPAALCNGETGFIRYVYPLTHENGYPATFNGAAIKGDGELSLLASSLPYVPVVSASFREVKELKGKGIDANRLCFSICEQLAIASSRKRTGSADESKNHSGSVNVWALHDKVWLRTWTANTQDVLPLPDGRGVLMCVVQEGIRLWDLHTGKCDVIVGDPQPTPTMHRPMELGPDGRTLVILGDASWAEVWDIAKGVCIGIADAGEDEISDVAFSPDGRYLFIGNRRGSIHLFDISTGNCRRVCEGIGSSIVTIRASPDGLGCFVVLEDQSIWLWDSRSGKCIPVHYSGSPQMEYRFGGRSHILSNVHPDGRCTLGTSNGHLHFLHLRGHQQQVPYVTAARLWRASLSCIDSRSGPCADPKYCASDVLEGTYDQELSALCPWCGIRFTPTSEILEMLSEAVGITEPGDNVPAKQLPQHLWNDERLRNRCSHCDKPLRFNPFQAYASGKELEDSCIGVRGERGRWSHDLIAALVDSPHSSWTEDGLITPTGLFTYVGVVKILMHRSLGLDWHTFTPAFVTTALSSSGLPSQRASVLNQSLLIAHEMAQDDVVASEQFIGCVVESLGWMPDHSVGRVIRMIALDACIEHGAIALPSLLIAAESSRCVSWRYYVNVMIALAGIAPDDERVLALLQKAAADPMEEVRERIMRI